MKFTVESLPEGVIVCDIPVPLRRVQAEQIIQGIAKTLANGKARIIVKFSESSAGGEGGADFLEKSLRPLKALAVKMNGDIKLVVPGPVGNSIFGALPTLEVAVAQILGRPFLSPTEQKDIQNDLASKTREIEKLKTEILRLTDKLRELMEVVRQPSTNAELQSALEHFQLLAAKEEAPAQASAQPVKAEKPKGTK